jgi:predicted N-acetyltransferase YhbS
MQVTDIHAARHAEIAALFEATFTASEGAEEGALIGALAGALLSETPPQDLRVFLAEEGTALIGAAIFTRLRFGGDEHTAFLLSPMAVATDHQGTGVGQALLSKALDTLRAEGIDIAVTYGDPAFYGKLGFAPVSTETVPSPHTLNQPEGWIAQPLIARALPPLQGPATCASALDDPAYW